MKKGTIFFSLIFIILLGEIVTLLPQSFFGGFFVFAETDKEKEKAELEEELRLLELEISNANRNLTATEAEKQSLQYQINKVQGEINQLSTQITRNKLAIQNLGLKINDTQGSIVKTTEKIAKSREELSETLRTMNMEGRISTLEILIMEENLSSVFNSLSALERLSEDAKSVLDEVKELKLSLQGYKEELETDKTETEKIAKLQELQKQEEEKARAERQRLYGLTEAEYQKQLAEKKELEKKAEEIKQRIFELVGLPDDVEAPTFEEAYEIAKWVEGMTGIRPAFLLSILQQESALGKNVGQCYLVSTTSGSSKHIKTGQVYSNGMHPTRDVPPFLTITKDLNKDPLQTSISCPMSFGYGGAMGPAQFIPSTWMLYKNRIDALLGRAGNPWSIRDAFLASGILLTDSGAKSQTRQGEWRAAMIYFSGGTTKSEYFWYADQVIIRADGFEKDIATMLKK
jgi:peptidoglycan hydrolase CwlO-like protein